MDKAPKIFKEEDGFHKHRLVGDHKFISTILAQLTVEKYFKDQGFQTGYCQYGNDMPLPYAISINDHEPVSATHKILFRVEKLEEEKPCDLDHKTVYEIASIEQFKNEMCIGRVHNVKCPRCKKDVSNEGITLSESS